MVGRERASIMQSAKESAIGWSVILAGCLAIILTVTTYTLEPIVPTSYLRYFQVAEVAVVGFNTNNQ
ncbi:MAG TPA: hypothetical protein VFS97_05735 [Nitrososphaeraceae archaeon]|nr:hypothetical protein [Nitrososphaeraceae archaeon]